MRVGVDMIEVSRIGESFGRFGERFYNKLFTAAERQLCEDQPHRLAARFAGKEATAKALGTGIGDIQWKEIEIVSDGRGRPILKLYGAALQLAESLGISQWEISLSHTDTLAIAFVVMM